MSHRLVIVVLVYNSADDARTCMDQLLAFGGDFRVSFDATGQAFDNVRLIGPVSLNFTGTWTSSPR